MQINVAVTDANNIVCEVVPPQTQTITIDRGVAGNGIVSIVPVTISTFQYLRITYTNGTVQDVGPLTSTAYTATAPITIVGNTISLATVPIASGGTNATTAADAIQNLLPSYTGNANKRLGLNSAGTALEWVADGGGTVTSVAMTVPTGLAISGSPITSSGTLALTMASGYAIPTTASQTNWDTAYSERQQWSGTATNLVASTGRTSLGATTLGSNLFTITNPSAITFPRFNADNTVSALDAATFRTAIGAGTSSTTGTVTSVSGTGTVNGLTLTGTVTTSGSLTLGGTLSGIANSALTNSSITIGGTTIALGGSSNSLSNDITVYGVTIGRGTGSISTNTAVGASALAANTTGNSNTAIGRDTLASNTTASQNTAIGYQAAYSNTTGTRNFAGGVAALALNTTGNYNIAIGHEALTSNTTASSNTAVGYQAGYANATGTNGVYIGYQAGYSSTLTGFVAVGAQAGFSKSSSDTYASVFVGTNAGIQVTTGTDNTFVGGYSGRYVSTGNANTAVGAAALGGAGSTGSGNTAIGGYWSGNIEAPLFYNTTGSSNTAIAPGALKGNTTGSANVAIGNGALAANTTASNNTAVGYQAAYTNTTGQGITAIGKGALLSSTGDYNTAIGRSAGGATTSGINNFFGGVNAAAANTTGSFNTAIGGLNEGYEGALESNTTGSYNTVLGSGALKSNTTASANTAVGYKAGYTNTTGTGSTFVGINAGYTSSGSYNTCIGRSAGFSLTTGTKNTFIGGSNTSYGSGDLITTGSANTIIGNFNGNQNSLDIRTASNYIVLSDGDGNPRIYNNGAGYTTTDVVRQFNTSFYAVGNQTYVIDVTVPDNGGNGGLLKVCVGYNHYSDPSYGAWLEAFVSYRSSGLLVSTTVINQNSTGYAGGWSVTIVGTQTIRLSKSAGSGAGGGYGFANVMFNPTV
jgi:hypothetical protein